MTRSATPALLLASLTACDVSAPPDASEEAPPLNGPGAELEVLLTDAPGPFDEVWVDLHSIAIQSAAGWQTLSSQPQSFDLLTLQNDITAALGGATLAPDTYGQLRLFVDSAHVMIAGKREELKIASAARTGIKIPINATLEADVQYQLVLDFDAAKSIKQTGQGWLMTPVIRLEGLTGTQPPPVGLGAAAR